MRDLFMATSPIQLDGPRIADALVGITLPILQAYAEAAAVCLARQGHGQAFALRVRGNLTADLKLRRRPLTDKMRRAHADFQEATEVGAVCLAFAVITQCTPYTVIERSFKGTGIDYWLGHRDEGPFYQNKARLEVSGILDGSESLIRSRIRQKKKQAEMGGRWEYPLHIIVIDFAEPQARTAS